MRSIELWGALAPLRISRFRVRFAPRNDDGRGRGDGREAADLGPPFLPTISCRNITPVPQALGQFRPMWYLAGTSFDRHTWPTVLPLRACGGGDIWPHDLLVLELQDRLRARLVLHGHARRGRPGNRCCDQGRTRPSAA